MIELELEELVKKVQDGQAGPQTLEVFPAHQRCPVHLYDTLSAFSNQDSGGVILFGLNADRGFAVEGVYDTLDLQKQITAQCRQMEPAVKPLFTVWKHKNGAVVSAEIPALDPVKRPCYYPGMGKIKGAYVRNGDSNELLPAYVIHSFETFQTGALEDIQINYAADMCDIRMEALKSCMSAIRSKNSKLAGLLHEDLGRFLGMTLDGKPTLACTLLFSVYPQLFYPWYVVDISVIQGNGKGNKDDMPPVNQCRVEGTIPEMLDGVLSFFRSNLKLKTVIDPKTKRRNERYEYPMDVLREGVLNALVHRDYSIYTRSIPVKVFIYKDRIEIRNPGGFYGDVQPSTRNPVLARFLEALGIMKNRHFGLTAMQQKLRAAGMKEAVIVNMGTEFCITFYNGEQEAVSGYDSSVEEKLLDFCEIPRSRQEIAGFLGMTTIFYVSEHYINPLVEKGKLHMTIPGHPKSKKQKFFRL